MSSANDLLTGLLQQLEQRGLSIVEGTEGTSRQNQIPVEIQQLNETYASVNYGNKEVVLWEHADHRGQTAINFLSVTDFRTKLGNRFLYRPNADGTQRKVALSKAWLESEHRRSYDGVVFDPSNTAPPNFYNMYRGFALEPIEGDWSLMRQHIFEVLCDKNQEHFDYFIAWMARIIQDPGGKRPGTLIAIRGGQGCGKGIIVQTFGKIFGSHYQYINNQQQLTGKFNSHLQNTLFINVDEGFFAGSKTDEGVLKGLTTEDILTIEPKGKDAFLADNHTNIIITSNAEWIVPAGEDERRYFVLTAANHHQRDYEYFTALANEIDNGGIEAFLYALMHWDISKVNLREVPKTEGLFKQKIHNFTPVQRFWFDTLISGYASYRDDTGQSRYLDIFGSCVASNDLYQAYLNFCTQQRITYLKGKSQFVDELKSFCPLLQSARVASVDSNTRVRGYKYPSLDACRAAMGEKLAHNIDWEQWTDLDGGGADGEFDINLDGGELEDAEFIFLTQ